jgi:hypothetical protein
LTYISPGRRQAANAILKTKNDVNDKQADYITQLKKLIALLNKIERTGASERSKAIGELQNKIWDEPELQIEELYFLQDLAGDLNFYEPIEKDRDEALGYYDDGRLLELIAAAQKKIESLMGRS